VGLNTSRHSSRLIVGEAVSMWAPVEPVAPNVMQAQPNAGKRTNSILG
jgi:hypothetical protein